VKPDVNLVKVHPQLSHNGHPMDGAMVGAGPLWQACSDPRVAQAMLLVIL